MGYIVKTGDTVQTLIDQLESFKLVHGDVPIELYADGNEWEFLKVHDGYCDDHTKTCDISLTGINS